MERGRGERTVRGERGGSGEWLRGGGRMREKPGVGKIKR